MRVLVRQARASDADDIIRLTKHLGYDVDAGSMRERLPRLLARPDQHVLIAEVEGTAVGWLHASVWECIEADAFVVIGGLVVDREHRGKGIGRALLERAEQWALSQGCGIVRLWSSSVRTEAHKFYEHLGYQKLKMQYSFAKPVDPSRAGDLQHFVPRVER